MNRPLYVFYGDEILTYYFGPSHPFNQKRVKLSVDLMKGLGLFSHKNQLLPIRQASIEEALAFHQEKYINFLQEVEKTGDIYLDQGDTPSFRGCLQASLWIVGATLQALDAVLTESVYAFNPGGGLHHAHRYRASGFCILNDAAIALEIARRKYGINKAAYIDIDVHHGDGVFYGFYAEDWLLDLDLHQDGRTLFPGTGFVQEIGEGSALGLKRNIPLAPGASDDSAMYAWREVIEPSIREFKPELIVMQCGADAHYGDPLAMLSWSNNTYTNFARSIAELSEEICNGRLLLLGGGGYKPSNACLAWAAIALTVSGQEAPDSLPDNWTEKFKEAYGYFPPESILEPETQDPRTLQSTQKTVQNLKALIQSRITPS